MSNASDIQLRAWDSTMGCMFDEAYLFMDAVLVPDAGLFANPVKFKDPHGSGRVFVPLPSSNEVMVMRWTGLCDVNGVKIFEGDVVETTVNKHIWRGVGTIHQYGFLEKRIKNFHVVDNGFCSEIESVFGAWEKDQGHTQPAPRSIVIGNIHENPELIEEEA